MAERLPGKESRIYPLCNSKRKSLNPYTQEDITLLMNHINSVKRPGLGNKSPYELISEEDEDMMALMSLLKMHLIPPDEVHLKPDLFVRK